MATDQVKIRKGQGGKKVAPEGKTCATMPLDELRTLLQDVRRRLNTIDEKLEQACEMTKE